MARMNLTLRAGERLFINGAVLRTDRKVTLELLNDVAFLLENHVIQASDATTLLRQIYFAVQIMLMDPASLPNSLPLAEQLLKSSIQSFQSPLIVAGLREIGSLIQRQRYYDALKALRALYVYEQAEMHPSVSAKETTTQRISP